MSPSASTLESRALALLEDTLEQPTHERVAYVEGRTSDDPELRRRVLTLLASAERGAHSIRTGGAGADADEPDPPERVGAYRLTGLIGRGGMGAVYRAERDAGDFTHTVAVKLVRSGVLSGPLTERFTRERQILAGLSHPNIARLFDGGQTTEGQPYIVMELVDGRPITDWARERRLDTAARVRLFLAACEAVRFAHQNLIVHRDLTPSNVLVTDAGEVKLIDFGISRPPEAEAAGPAREASLGSLSLTPGFAAPERTTGAGASTLVDVFSLGRLLQALLADLTPDADLEAVGQRAAAEDPAARYPAVDALIEDLRRWLEGRAVAARGGGRRYAFGKFVRRHSRAVAASVAAVALLTGALVVTLMAYGAAEAARAAEARRFAELRQLAGYMLFDLNAELQRTPGNTAARARLAAQAQSYLSRLAGTPGASAELRLETARGLIALARAQGVPGQPNLGDSPRARANLEAALRLLNAPDVRRSGASDAAEAGASLAMISLHGDTDEPAAQRHLAVARAALDGVSPAERADRWRLARLAVLRTELDAGVLAGAAERLPALATALEREVDGWPAALRGSPEAEMARAYADQNRATHGYLIDDFPPGVAAAQRAEQRLLRLDAARPNDPRILYDLAWTAYAGYGVASGLPETQAESARFLAVADDAIGRLLRLEANDMSLRNFYAQTGQARSQLLSTEGRHREALVVQREVLTRMEAAVNPERRPASLNRLAVAHFTMGRLAVAAADRRLACASFARARAMMTDLRSRGELVGSQAANLAAAEAEVARCGPSPA